ncbi:protein kinase [Streptomyces sp. NPDC090022]|uniref:protein kinase domain-containing protein n=1 Tax=Streptomyces sp. NPDC090022 TaxID=3365920 RepID=UPI00382646E0
MLPDARVVDDRYELRTPLGEGAMGQVWHGYDRELERAVAIKVINPYRLAAGDRGRQLDVLTERFRREARLIARFPHPGIPVLYDARLGREAGALYLVMELILGEDLDQVLRRRTRLPAHEAVSIGVQICDVLDHLHAEPVIHRDLKPANIMLTGHGRVKLLDFGTAAVFGTGHARLTTDGQVLGTVGYMAPEQFDSDLPLTPRSDLYALGCVLYHLLAGEPPFTGPSGNVMYDHRFRAPVPLRKVCPDVAPDLEALVLETLAKRPGDRPSSARTVNERLRRLAAETGPGAAGSPRTAQPAPRPATPDPTPDPASAPAPAPAPAVASALSVQVRLVQAAALFDDGRYGAALPAYRALAEELTAVEPPQPDAAADCRVRAAYCCQRLGDTDRALHEFRALAAELSASRPPEDPLLLTAMRHVGLLLAEAGQPGPALEALANVYPTLVAVLGKDAAETAQVRAALNRIRTGG